MSWMLIIGLSLIVFINRYIFLEPKFQFQLPIFIQKMLKYAAPCLMVSLCVPIIFYQNHEFRELIHNVYLYSAIITIVVAQLTQKLLLSIVLSLFSFYGLMYFLN
ncbi:branched-chain amino acid transporter [Acinetobacter sp. ANC 4558]|uniref:AzlD domain-containing protein n=1 Tax=Acinetobacter sp. ANC 4558 TaxID=1977876 RepID=UPI000A32F45D|nr:AzlD domain-containing protein [Acinetobacter sp. ANC 4558]OTG87591.1 branched-chain amino acid transporter [Acinetobacter sp. ANC 4558]